MNKTWTALIIVGVFALGTVFGAITAERRCPKDTGPKVELLTQPEIALVREIIEKGTVVSITGSGTGTHSAILYADSQYLYKMAMLDGIPTVRAFPIDKIDMR